MTEAERTSATAPAPARVWRRRWLVLVFAADVLSYALAVFGAYQIRFGAGEPAYMIVNLLGDDRYRLAYVPAFAMMFPVWLGVLFFNRCYSWRHVSYPPFELRRVLSALTLGVAMFGLFSFGFRANINRPLLLVLFGVATISVPAGRLIARNIWKRWRRRAGARARTLIVGANREGRIVADIMIANLTFDFVPVGFVDDDPQPAGPDFVHDIPVVGGTKEILDLVDSLHVSAVFIVDSMLGAERTGAILRALRPRDVEVRISANLPEILAWRLAIEPITGFPMLSIDNGKLERFNRFAKRTLDVAGSAGGLLALSPLLIGIAIAIRIDSRGPVFFRQLRAGHKGKPFRVFKYRTMVTGADTMKLSGEIASEVDGPIFKIRDDPRVTRVGRFLRRYSLDELPQLINVLVGQMSLVGPRPLPLHEQEELDEIAPERLEVRPGITGLWQVSGRSDAPLERLVRLDLFYVENWSIAYDLYVLYKTIPAVLKKSGAY
ncbi:MAG TPA: sugar transferase [Actinomycetota bacterium]